MGVPPGDQERWVQGGLSQRALCLQSAFQDTVLPSSGQLLRASATEVEAQVPIPGSRYLSPVVKWTSDVSFPQSLQRECQVDLNVEQGRKSSKLAETTHGPSPLPHPRPKELG